jgi:hypothetical protein
MLQSGLVNVFKTILRDVGVPEVSLIVEARGLRVAYRSKHGDVVALDFSADGRRLVIDAVMTTIYRNTML